MRLKGGGASQSTISYVDSCSMLLSQDKKQL